MQKTAQKVQLERLPPLALLPALAAAVLALSACANTDKAARASAGAQEADSAYIMEETLSEYTKEELYVEAEGRQIFGVLYLPKMGEGEKAPLAVFSHGFGSSYERAHPYAAALAQAGYAAFAFDFCGGGLNSRSTGSTQEMSIFTELDDLEAVIAKMKELDFVDIGNIFLVGASQGGAVSALAAAAHPEDVRGLVLVYPAFVIPDDARKAFSDISEVPDEYQLMGMTIGKAYYEGLFDFDIFEAIAPYTGNVLIIHGDADALVPLSYSERALDVYASAELKVIDGANHGFTEEEARQAIAWILEYLQQETVGL